MNEDSDIVVAVYNEHGAAGVLDVLFRGFLARGKIPAGCLRLHGEEMPAKAEIVIQSRRPHAILDRHKSIAVLAGVLLDRRVDLCLDPAFGGHSLNLANSSWFCENG